MHWVKLLGLAGVVSVAASGVVIARDERRREAYTPEQIRARLHERFESAVANEPDPTPQAGDEDLAVGPRLRRAWAASTTRLIAATHDWGERGEQVRASLRVQRPTMPRPTMPRPTLPRPTLPRPTIPRPSAARTSFSAPARLTQARLTQARLIQARLRWPRRSRLDEDVVPAQIRSTRLPRRVGNATRARYDRLRGRSLPQSE